MIKLTGYGHGRANNWGGGDRNSDGDGNGDGRDSIYITALVINDDPIAAAYQAATLQTSV